MMFDMEKLQPYLDKMKIVFKEPCKKWGMYRYHYGIKIGDEVFNYFGSAKEYEDELKCIEYAKHNYWLSTRKLWIMNRDKTDDEHKYIVLFFYYIYGNNTDYYWT